MDRRKFLRGVGATPLVAIVPTAASPKEGIRYKLAEEDRWLESIAGEEVEFSSWFDWNMDCQLTRIWWRSHQKPRVTYALAYRLTAEQIADDGRPLIEIVKGHEQTDVLRFCMRNTILRIRDGVPVPSSSLPASAAPIKPEGAACAHI